MSTLLAIVIGGVAMTAVAFVGVVTTFLSPRMFDRLVVPLVAVAAGSLTGGALFHMLPKAVDRIGATPQTFGLVALGAFTFLLLEQFLHWHHCHRSASAHANLAEFGQPCRESDVAHGSRAPVGYLILVADGLHNFLGGLAVGAAFILDVRVGLIAWLVAAAHEVPQELGDFGLLVHSGWSRMHALMFNVLSASTFLVGGLVAYAMSGGIDVTFLVPFAAGNFLYIAMSDLVPQLTKDPSTRAKLGHTAAYGAGLILMYVVTFL